jgi:hypothetical protein
MTESVVGGSLFAGLGALGHERSMMQGIGFYIAYLFVVFEISLLVGSVVGITTGAIVPSAFYDFSHWLTNGVADVMVQAGWAVGIVFTLGLGALVLRYKGLMQNFVLVSFVLLGGVLAIFFGAFLGLIPIAFITTRESHI